MVVGRLCLCLAGRGARAAEKGCNGTLRKRLKERRMGKSGSAPRGALFWANRCIPFRCVCGGRLCCTLEGACLFDRRTNHEASRTNDWTRRGHFKWERGATAHAKAAAGRRKRNNHSTRERPRGSLMDTTQPPPRLEPPHSGCEAEQAHFKPLGASEKRRGALRARVGQRTLCGFFGPFGFRRAPQTNFPWPRAAFWAACRLTPHSNPHAQQHKIHRAQPTWNRFGSINSIGKKASAQGGRKGPRIASCPVSPHDLRSPCACAGLPLQSSPRAFFVLSGDPCWSFEGRDGLLCWQAMQAPVTRTTIYDAAPHPDHLVGRVEMPP